MSAGLDEFVADIVAQRIEKRDALRRFETLAAPDRELLLSKLKLRLGAPSGGVPLLECCEERDLSAQQLQFIADLAERCARFAPRSKQNALGHQEYFVDARKVANLKRSTKALQFHLTYARAEGACLYDIDGNEYIDITGDNGVNLFGSQPEFIKAAVTDRLNGGYPLVGYTEELFQAARLFCELTGHQRMAFTQSGTEAVLWAVRLARAATGRSKIVIFEGSYHGLSDTVGAMRDYEGKSVPAGLGIPQSCADELIVLEYGNMAHLQIIEEHAAQIAGVLVEPVQASQPHIQPAEFLKELRKSTLAGGIVLIFDEMITGFRVCPRGAQGYFGVKADVATYGKVAGGGMPTGMIAGSARYMDLIDGGKWAFEGDSMPKLERIYIGGTHTRNPLKITAALAALSELRRRCPGELECANCQCFQKEVTARTRAMAEELNGFLRQRRVPLRVDHFASLFKFRFEGSPFGIVRELFLVLLRLNGVETSVSGNFFLTAAHTDAHVKRIVNAVQASITTLLEAGFFRPRTQAASADEEVKVRPVPVAVVPAPSGPRGRSDEQELNKLRALIRADWQMSQEGVR